MITVKEEFLGSVKTRRAIKLGGAEILALWLALKGYVSVSNSGGFIPEESVSDLPGVPKRWRKVMDALVNCGKLHADGTRGPGLVERVEFGFQLHDYEDHGTPVEVESERRRKAREQKRRRRAAVTNSPDSGQFTSYREANGARSVRGQEPDTLPDIAPDNVHSVRGQVTGQNTGHETGQEPDTSAGQPPCASGPAPVRERDPQPSPAQKKKILTTTTTDRSGLRAVSRPDGGGGGGGETSKPELTPCPADLRLTDAQIATLETSMIPKWAIDVLTARFVASCQSDAEDKRSLVVWRKCMSQAISGWWNNPRQRPRECEAAAEPESIRWAE